MTPCANHSCRYAAAAGSPYCCAVCQNAYVIGKYGYAWHSDGICSRIKIARAVPKSYVYPSSRRRFRRQFFITVGTGAVALLLLFTVAIIWGWK
jgi:hypothetical protein